MDDEQPTTDAGFSRVESLGYKFYRLAQLFAHALDERLVDYGVSVAQFRLLLVLWEREQLTQAEIAHYLGIEQPTVASTLKRMKRDGLITTAVHPSDGRRMRILLTERGHMLKESLTMEAQYVNDAAVKDLLSEEIAQLHKLLDQIANTLTDAKE